MYPYVTLVKISSVGFLPPPPCSLDSPLPFFPLASLSGSCMVKRTFVLQAFPKQYIYIYFFFCFVLFFVVRNPHHPHLYKLSRKGCRDEEGRGTQTGAFAWLKTLLKYQGGSCYSLLLTVIRQQLGNWWDNKNEMVCAFHRSYQCQKRNWLWKRHTS